MFYKAGKKVVACVLSGMMLCSWNGVPVYAETAEPSAETAAVSESAGTETLTDDGGYSDSTAAQAEEGSSRVLLPSAGFSYSFSANKVSLSDVKNSLDSSSAGQTESSDAASGSSEDTQTTSADGKSISETSLTPVQKQEQSVVSAVSQTQGIEIDNATATILSATAVTVVSDAQTAVSLAKLADKKQTQAKLDQGVITASEAEALMAASDASSSVKVDNVSGGSGEGTQGETVVIAIPGAAGTEADSAAAGTEDSAAAAATEAEGAAAAGDGTAVSGEGSDDADTGSTGLWEKIPEDEMLTTGADGTTSADASADGGSQSAAAGTAAADETAAEGASAAGTASSTENAASAQSTAEGTSEAAAAASTEQSSQNSDAVSSASTSSVATDSDGKEIVVAQVDSYINIRADASQDADIIGKLYNGSVAHVLGRTGNGWARVQSGGVTGFIREEYVATGSTAQQLADAVSTKQAVVSTMTLRVRAAAEADSDVITLVGEGQTLDILEEVDGWYKINTPDGVGYISADFADAEEVYPEAVSKEQEEAEEAARKAEEEAANAAASDSAAASSDDDSSASSGSEKSSSSGGSLNTYSGSSASGTTAGQAVVNYALQFVGNPYVWGGSSLTNGTDCSGFTMAVYANFGYSLPHYTGSQMSCGTAVASLDEAQPGDLILYNGHVGIYMGNNQIVHASNPRTGITTGTATYRHIVAIRRIIN